MVSLRVLAQSTTGDVVISRRHETVASLTFISDVTRSRDVDIDKELRHY